MHKEIYTGQCLQAWPPSTLNEPMVGYSWPLADAYFRTDESSCRDLSFFSVQLDMGRFGCTSR